MNICKKCNNQFSDKMQFCPKCGCEIENKPKSLIFKHLNLIIVVFFLTIVLAFLPKFFSVEKNEDTFLNSIGIQFVLVKAGEFEMGSNDSENDVRPIHRVKITKDFYIGKYEVTQAQWQAVMGNNPSIFQECGENCPVDSVSYNDVQEFIKKLNAKEKTNKYRLPTEAQWEYVAQGGNENKEYKYSGSDNVKDVAEYIGNNNSNTKPVGGKKPNELGIYDMSGNVWEWVQDKYNSRYYKKSSIEDPVNLTTGTSFVLRGGAWNSSESNCRIIYRDLYSATLRIYFNGFRLACDL